MHFQLVSPSPDSHLHYHSSNYQHHYHNTSSSQDASFEGVERSVKFVVETVQVLEEEEGEEELLGFSASPVEVVVAITVSS